MSDVMRQSHVSAAAAEQALVYSISSLTADVDLPCLLVKFIIYFVIAILCTGMVSSTCSVFESLSSTCFVCWLKQLVGLQFR